MNTTTGMFFLLVSGLLILTGCATTPPPNLPLAFQHANTCSASELPTDAQTSTPMTCAPVCETSQAQCIKALQTCKMGDQASCMKLAEERATSATPKSALLLWELVCRAKNASGCRALADAYHTGRFDRPDIVKAYDIMSNTCSFAPDVCHEYSKEFELSTRGVRDFDKSWALLKLSCTHGHVQACHDIVDVWSKPAYRERWPEMEQLLDTMCTQYRDAKACSLLAHRIRTSPSFKKNAVTSYPRVFSLLKKSCEGGLLDSCAWLGRLTENGVGTKRNPDRAVRVYEATCNKDSAMGCHFLADAHARGLGVLPKDAPLSRQMWATLCKDRRTGESCLSLGKAQYYGHSVKVNYQEAVRWYERGCDVGYGPSCNRAALVYSRRLVTSVQNDTKERLFERGCDLGYSVSCAEFYWTVYRGNYIRKDIPKARAKFEELCQEGELLGCVFRAILYEEEKHAPYHNIKKAVASYEKYCPQSWAACARLAILYEEGRGVKKDLHKAEMLLRGFCGGGKNPGWWGCKDYARIEKKKNGVIK